MPFSIMKAKEVLMSRIEKREKRGAAFYRELMELHARSGKTQREFAEGQGIPPGTLSGWFHRLRKLDAPRGQKGTAKARSSRGRTNARLPVGEPPFLPVQVVEPVPPPSRGSGYELVLGRGVLRLPADFDPLRVGALLRAVEAVC
jgi:hypothetical protein